MAPPLIGLTHLEIHKFSPSFAEFCGLFDANPTLSSLCLPRFLPRCLPNETYFIIDASSLRSFVVGLGLHKGSEKCRCFLPFLRMDNVEYLEIIGDPHTRHFSRDNGLQKVRTLRFHHLQMTIDPVDTSFWSALREVTRVEACHLRGLSGILGASSYNKPGSQVYLPRLTSILFYSCGLLDDDCELFDALCARSTMGLSRIEVPSYLQGSPHPHVKASLDAAGIDLMFVDTPEYSEFAFEDLFGYSDRSSDDDF